MSDLGVARGRIEVSTEGVRAAQREVASASRDMSQALGQVGKVLGITFGAQQVARFAVEADRVATAYERQSVAALGLAGSQGKLNELLETYDRATGGVIDRAQALSDVTRLQAIGFADSAAELDRFARAARGISVAMGASQDYIISQLTLAIANQSMLRLDQIGLDATEAKERIDELKAANKGMSDGMIYQQAIMEQAERKFGALADSAEAQATGIEAATQAIKDFRLELGKTVGVPLDFLGDTAALFLDIQTARLKAWINELDIYIKLLRQMGMAGPWLTSGERSFVGDMEGRTAARRNRQGTGEIAPRFDAEQQDAISEWSREVASIERQANRDRLAATQQYEQQRSDTIRQYEQTIARNAQDFAIARLRAEEDYAIGLQRFRRDIAQREARQLEDLERTIAEARTDAAEQATERQVALDERLAEVRATSRERVAEMEEDFQRRRERAARDHQESLADAAGRLDALAVARQQRDFIKRQRDEQEDFDVRLEKERKSEAKRLAELEKANAKQIDVEQKALAERIAQANEAYQRQLSDARAADEQRLSDMSADFALRQQRENEDRALRLQRLKEDHDAQLAEQARQHLNRIVELNRQEAEETQLANEALDERMAALDIFHADYLARQTAHETRSLLQYQKYLDAQEAELARRTAIQGPTNLLPATTPGGWPSMGTAPAPYNPVPGWQHNSGNSSISIGNISVYGAPTDSPYDFAQAFRRELQVVLQEVA